MASKNARYPKGFRASLFILVTPAIQAGGFRSLQEGQQVQFEVTKGPTSRTTGCRCVVEHCAGDEERCPRRSTNPRVIRLETMSNQTFITIIHEFFTVR